MSAFGEEISRDTQGLRWGSPSPLTPGWRQCWCIYCRYSGRRWGSKGDWISIIFWWGCSGQSCIILIPEPSFCQAIMGNLICSTLELKMGKTILYFLFVCCKWRIKFSEFLISRLQIEAFNWSNYCVHIALHIYQSLTSAEKVFSWRTKDWRWKKWIWKCWNYLLKL